MSRISYYRGLKFENDALAFLNRLNMPAQFHADKDNHGPDVMLKSGLTVEVKGATCRKLTNRTHGYFFILKRCNSPARPITDYVLLICRDLKHKRHYFLIPYAQTEFVQGISITSPDPTKYRGKWAKYLIREEDK